MVVLDMAECGTEGIGITTAVGIFISTVTLMRTVGIHITWAGRGDTITIHTATGIIPTGNPVMATTAALSLNKCKAVWRMKVITLALSMAC
jgi:hypothetical protein